MFRLRVQGDSKTTGASPLGPTQSRRGSVVAAQFVVGLGHLEGYGIEKNERSAYYWFEDGRRNFRCDRTANPRSFLEKLRGTLKTDEIEAVEQMVGIWVQENKLRRSKRPAEFSRTTTDPGPLQMLRESLLRGKAKAAS
jgi:hypothetical protein